MKRVLITGAAGHIGRALRAGLRGQYQLRLADIVPQAPAGEGEEVLSADITRLAELLPVMQGVDVVVHLAGVPDEDRWEKVRDLNIEGCYNVFEAARQAGVKRVVFASSNHAVGFHRRDRMIDDTVAPRPDSRYGVSKVFGEALGRMYADKHGLSVACMRIGSFRPDDTPTEPRHLFTWISHRDTVQLTKRCIDYPDYHFLIVYGVSGNARNRWDNANLRRLGYAPQDDAELHAARIASSGKEEDPREALFHGGFGCLVEFDGDPQLID
ncbi:Uronate dehydrogenase [Paraburkholderia graminis C4D1M]|uniref:NAD-dependent epimerase/dehydratase n=1 Tax=Paraburkholderia graminis (strain ATCC 700544 / DSM 17151 / LMG 18924 / NCIMB 13744 / C4D1M) TaxID=396598 RepID=B1G6J7_PARG4|nr:NAD(P)-dependent oxidoreductase [Paraburkholderia graminis]EDT08244.1 NAD-dependent epimerase/dehydratase [Paraburkholderia graminis C4D1M]CAB3723632.1 Uronate dehydrogenase [Paraburkholderia graminis C4D1M]